MAALILATSLAMPVTGEVCSIVATRTSGVIKLAYEAAVT